MKTEMIFTPAFPAEPRQALGLLSSIALSCWRVRAIKIVFPKLRWKTHLHKLIHTPD